MLPTRQCLGGHLFALLVEGERGRDRVTLAARTAQTDFVTVRWRSCAQRLAAVRAVEAAGDADVLEATYDGGTIHAALPARKNIHIDRALDRTQPIRRVLGGLFFALLLIFEWLGTRMHVGVIPGENCLRRWFDELLDTVQKRLRFLC